MEEKNKEQILNDLKSVISGFSQQLDAAKTSDQVEAIRVTALGRIFFFKQKTAYEIS